MSCLESPRKFAASYSSGASALFLIAGLLLLVAAGGVTSSAQESQIPAGPQQPGAPSQQQAQAQAHQPSQPQPPGQQPQVAVSNYDKSIFHNPVPSDQLAFLKRYDGASSGDLFRDKQFRQVMRSVTPDCMFHYGHDMPLDEAMDTVLSGSPVPVEIRDGRYVTISGRGRYLQGKGFIWVDLQEGAALGGFYFRPINGEPTPALNVFSQQVQDEPLAISQLPPAFVEDLKDWSSEFRVSPVVTSYFITGADRKILLEHDENYCVPLDGSAAPQDCEQMNADAAELDMNAASYVEQTHHATNATAWMITGKDQTAWLQFRENTCASGPDPLACRILITRQRVHVFVPGWRPPRRPSFPIPVAHK